jgi:hypothetical protein
MPKIKYHVCLTSIEQKSLLKFVAQGTATAKAIMHANVLLAADENGSGTHKNESEIAEIYHVNKQTVHAIRQKCSKNGVEAAIRRKKRKTPPVAPKITGDVQARIIAISCSQPPKGRARWSLRLLADKVVELNIIDSISHEAVGKVLKKTN